MTERVNDNAKNAEVKSGGNPHGFRIGVLSAFLVILAAIISVVFIVSVQKINQTYNEFEKATDNYLECESAANDMKEASNYLTIQVRSFIVTQDIEYLDNYFEEASVNLRREKAVATLEKLDANDSIYLSEALAESVELMDVEYYAMKLVCEAKGYQSLGENAAVLESFELRPEDAALSPDDKIALATELVFSDEYMQHVARIESNVQKCKEVLVDGIDDVRDAGADALHQLIPLQRVLTVVLFAVVLFLILSVVYLILWPIRTYVARIKKNKPLPNTGSYELRYLVKAYNEMYDDNLKNHDALRRKAEHDHLTGLYNRSVFERLLEAYSDEPYALLLIDADYFKQVNDSLGHDVGDAMLKKISNQLSQTFRATDYPCRIGGDEFAVVMTEMDESLKHVVSSKIATVVEGLADTSDGLPAMTLSIGVAFNDGTLGGDQIYKNADSALYLAKEAGRNGYRFYEG